MEVADVVVVMVQVVVAMKRLSWALLFAWVLEMTDQWIQCLKRAMVTLHLMQTLSIVLQFHSLSLLIKAILSRTFHRGAGRRSTQIHSILKAHIEAGEGFNIGASEI
jgi:hypothetical protein